MSNIVHLEDQKNIRRLAEITVTRGGHAYHGACTVRECLRLLRSQPVDALVLDLNLGNIGGRRNEGLRFLRRLRTIPTFSGFPVIVWTAAAQESDIRDAYCAGADYVLTKPTCPYELLKIVERYGCLRSGGRVVSN